MELRISLIIYLKNVKWTMINKYKKIVIKIGSSSIVDPISKKINSKWMKKLCKDIEKYHKNKNGIEKT